MRQICLAILSVGLMFSLAMNASANTESSWTTRTVNGQSYKFNSSVWNRSLSSGNTVEAVAQVKTTNKKAVEVGYMGAQARLYTSGGALKCTSGVEYNTAKAQNIYVYSSRTSSSGYFYSQSKVYLYNGNGYTTYTANKSPNGKVQAVNPRYCLYQTTEDGRTYGSGLYSEMNGGEPDLIKAIGVSGEEGYITSSDISPDVDTIEEAILVSEEMQEDRLIPVYNLNGEQIDVFLIQGTK